MLHEQKSELAAKSRHPKKAGHWLLRGPMLCLGTLLVVAPSISALGFIDLTERAGLGGYVAIPSNGHAPGAVFADLDEDGFPDLYLIGLDPLRGSTSFNAVYVNCPGPTGSRVFDLLPPGSGGSVPSPSNGAVAADYDNDGDLDLYVISFGPNTLLQNQLVETGSLSFIDVTASTDPTPTITDDQLGVGYARGTSCDGSNKSFDLSLSAAWSDVDRDGDPDLYVATHNGFAIAFDDQGNFGWDPTRPPAQTSDLKPGSRDTFYRNNGDGTFTDMTDSLTSTVGLTGFETATGAVETQYQCYASANAVIFADLNLDLWPDLLVTNKTVTPDDRDMLYLNLGVDSNGVWQGFEVATYTVPAVCHGQPACFGQMSPAAMGIDVGDPDNDGDFDIYITDISGDPNSLPPPHDSYLFNDLWVNQLTQSGSLEFVFDSNLPLRTSWGAQWQDFDNDGDEDLHVTSSFSDGFYLNAGSTPPSFSEEAATYGLSDPLDGRGNATADLDNDGWVDLLVIRPNSLDQPDPFRPSALWLNQMSAIYPENHYLSLKLVGDPAAGHGPPFSTTDAIGARVLVSADLDDSGAIEAGERQLREVRSGTGNAATTSSLELEYGLGLASQVTIHVFWPSGAQSVIEAQANQHLRIVEGVDGSLILFRDGFESGDTLVW